MKNNLKLLNTTLISVPQDPGGSSQSGEPGSNGNYEKFFRVHLKGSAALGS
jgi:hypothetical protein